MRYANTLITVLALACILPSARRGRPADGTVRPSAVGRAFGADARVPRRVHHAVWETVLPARPRDSRHERITVNPTWFWSRYR